MTEPTVIDIHPHIIAGESDPKYPRSPLFGKQSEWSRDRPVNVAQMIEAMDQAGVAKSAIVQASTCYGHDNSYVADAIARYPTRFSGVCSVDVRAADAPARMAEWRDKGLEGMRLFTGGTTAAMDASWLNDESTFPAWDYAGKINWSICIQTDGPSLPEVAKLAIRFPQVRIVLDHLARANLSDGPPYDAAKTVFDMAQYPNVYLKITPRIFAYLQGGKATPETFFPKLLGAFSAKRIAWGSNYPASEGTLSEILETALAALQPVAAEDKAWILAGTAKTLYPSLA